MVTADIMKWEVFSFLLHSDQTINSPQGLLWYHSSRRETLCNFWVQVAIQAPLTMEKEGCSLLPDKDECLSSHLAFSDTTAGGILEYPAIAWQSRSLSSLLCLCWHKSGWNYSFFYVYLARAEWLLSQCFLPCEAASFLITYLESRLFLGPFCPCLSCLQGASF